MLRYSKDLEKADPATKQRLIGAMENRFTTVNWSRKLDLFGVYASGGKRAAVVKHEQEYDDAVASLMNGSFKF